VTAVLDAPPPQQQARPRNGGAPARRAVARWSWRMFRREWRQQALILALLTLAVAATVIGLGFVSNVANGDLDGTMGTANQVITLTGDPAGYQSDVAALTSRFGTVDAIEHQAIPVPGSVQTLDLRDQSPHSTYGGPMLRLVSGRYPSGPGEVAVTKRAADLFGLHVGSEWTAGGSTRQVVGYVENPSNLDDLFALVAPGQISSPTSLSLLVKAPDSQIGGLNLPAREPVQIEGRGTLSKSGPEIAVLVLATIGLLFIGLLSVGGFAVLAARRQRALGMLGAVGASPRHIRLAMLSNGLIVGVAGALAGAAIGLGGWLAFAPELEGLLSRRIDRFDLPWWAIGLGLVLAVLTAVIAAWWPARTAARLSIVAALSGRPPRPQPAHRFAVVGAVFLGAGLGLLVLAHQNRPVLIVLGVVATTFGMLFAAPLAVRVLAPVARHTPIAPRIALRDLVRYQARSGAAIGAISLAIAISVLVTLNAAINQAKTSTVGGNLPANELMVYTTRPDAGPAPDLSADQQAAAGRAAASIASSVGANGALALEAGINPSGDGPGGRGKFSANLVRITKMPRGEEIQLVNTVYVATPQVLAFFGIDPSTVQSNADVLVSSTVPEGVTLWAGPNQITAPVRQQVALPTATSSPNALITAKGMQTLGLTPQVTAFLIRAPHDLTTKQIDAATKIAAGAGLTVESRNNRQSLAKLRDYATLIGILAALGVLILTVGLIRSETASDLRTLSAVGAGRRVRRGITSATAGALALLGAVLGTATAYGAMLVWFHKDLHPMRQVPVPNLLVILVGLPLLAAIGGWLVSGREPRDIARQPGVWG
jgi:putative ABC transport system permease protein